MILGTDSNKPWGKWDLLLAEAYQIFLDECCKQCGLPKYMCHSEDPDMQFVVETDVCEAKKAVALYEKNHSGKNGYEAPAGTQLIPRPIMADPERDFSDLRTPFYEQEAARLSDS